MRELNPIGREDNTLLLTSQDGEQFTVTVDETLMRTLKEHRVPDGSGDPLSPRQIQDAVRAGESISEIAERSGTSLSLVERFAHPVIEELQHMVDLALSVRVELPADRFNEIVKKPFGEVISENLAATGATEVSWSAKRSENSVWELTVRYSLEGEKGSAAWSFDPRRYQLTPETNNAQSLSKPGSTLDSPLRGVSKSIPAEHPSNGEQVITADNLEAFRSRRAKTETELPPSSQASSPDIESQIESKLSAEEEVDHVAEVIQITQIVEPVLEGLGEESQDLPADFDEIVDEPEQTTAPEPTKKSRAPMPSWDQIVRGTQSDDGEAF